ncbi:MAG: flagellar hook-basal body complex protein [Armatimonadota bacterium]|nr:flagellar hook-basal body complex protein [Armatimonadota bacterium]
MISGFYTSAAGMLGQIEQQDVISNNLANCNSPGYKRMRVGFSAFDVQMANALRVPPGAGSAHGRCIIPVAFARRDWKEGEIENATSATSLAIDGPGYFVVKTPSGETQTRDGSFRVNDAGRLVTSDGDEVLGQKGPIMVSSKNWQIDPDGRVKADGVVVDTLRIESPDDAPVRSKTWRVMQGRLESSNVNAIQETTGMITALRAYEANQRAIQAIDETLDKIINQTGRTG